MKLHEKYGIYQGSILRTLGSSREDKANSSMSVLTVVKSIQRRDRIKQESHHGPVVSGRFMQALARQNYFGIDTENMVTKQSEGSAEYVRATWWRDRVNEESGSVAWEIYADPREADLHRHREAREGKPLIPKFLYRRGGSP